MIQEYTGPEHNPMIPHTLVLKPGLVAHSIYNGYWFWFAPQLPICGETCMSSQAKFTDGAGRRKS